MKVLCALIIMLLPFVDCRSVRTGTFYLHSSYTPYNYIIIRDDSVQREIDLHNADTSYWGIKWLDDCTCRLTFIRQTAHDLFDPHPVMVRILNVTKNYYTFMAARDSLTGEYVQTDTLWFRPQHDSL